MLKISARNCRYLVSVSVISLCTEKSVLFSPGPQQIVRCVPVLNCPSGGFAKSEPLNQYPPFFLGFKVVKGATLCGASVPTKKKLLINSVSLEALIESFDKRIGNPLWNSVIPEIAQSLATLPTQPECFGMGRSQK